MDELSGRKLVNSKLAVRVIQCSRLVMVATVPAFFNLSRLPRIEKLGRQLEPVLAAGKKKGERKPSGERMIQGAVQREKKENLEGTGTSCLPTLMELTRSTCPAMLEGVKLAAGTLDNSKRSEEKQKEQKFRKAAASCGYSSQTPSFRRRGIYFNQNCRLRSDETY